MPKLIYLDSNDFSDLSSPSENLRAEDAAILAKLRAARDDGTALFLLSPPLLSEAVHATAANKSDSLRRASLMQELCGNNALRYPTDICKAELTRALSNDTNVALTLVDVLSAENEFFGIPYGASTLRESKLDAKRQIEQRLNSLPRDQRRKLKSQLNLSKASSRPLYRQLFKESDWKSKSHDFPMNLIDHELFQDWFLGEKSDSDVDQHLREIVSNPYVIFRHVADIGDHREKLYSMVRQGGGSLSTHLETLGENLIKLNDLASQLGQKINLRDLTRQWMSGAFLRNMTSTLSEQSVEHLTDTELSKLVDRCPSVSTLVHAMREYIHTFAQSNFMRAKNGNVVPTKPEGSDFGDFMHLLYAPYVDIFRCDARFGAHLMHHKHVVGKIASRRGQILQMLSGKVD